MAPVYAYAAVSLSNIVATTCQYEALKYVSFPVQTLGKCGKMFPVMVWGYIILKKRCVRRGGVVSNGCQQLRAALCVYDHLAPLIQPPQLLLVDTSCNIRPACHQLPLSQPPYDMKQGW